MCSSEKQGCDLYERVNVVRLWQLQLYKSPPRMNPSQARGRGWQEASVLAQSFSFYSFVLKA